MADRSQRNGDVVYWSDGSTEWYLGDSGKLHRIDGPAVIDRHGNKEWWYLGKKYDVCRWNDITKFYNDEDVTMLKLIYS